MAVTYELSRHQQLEVAVAKIKLICAEYGVAIASGDDWSAVFVHLSEDSSDSIRLADG